jgi:esterase/lipase superfamily enzyme
VDKVVERWWSPRTQRELTLARWGHWGAPLLVFPTAGGDAEEMERHHLLAHLQDAVDGGRIKVYSVDSTAGRALATHEGSTEHRMWLFNAYHDAIASEVVPAIRADTGGHEVVVAGSSIGAFNALACVCRYPHLFRAAICMSGSYHIEKFIGGSFTDDLYYSSPIHFLPGLEGPQLELLRQRFVVLASGSGRWEDPAESWTVANLLGSKGIPNRLDDWGPAFDHDWPTWWQMLPTYANELIS